jgi:hypothetical protein
LELSFDASFVLPDVDGLEREMQSSVDIAFVRELGIRQSLFSGLVATGLGFYLL